MKKINRHVKLFSRIVTHHVKLVAIPHHGNQYHPHAVRWYGLAALLIVTSVAVMSSGQWPASGSVLGVQATITSAGLLNDTNAQRQKDNELPLRYNDQLSAAAYMKAQDMFKQQYWAHIAPDGTTPWAWFAKAGYDYSYAGENLAKNFTTAGATVAAWMASPTHRANILDVHYTDVGFAVMDGMLNGAQTTLIVALYGQPASAVAGLTTAHQNNIPAENQHLSFVTRLGIAFQSMTPAVVGSVIVLLGGIVLAFVAHAYRRRLPLTMRKSWRYHHGLYKAVGLTSVVLVIVALYSGGQI